VANFHHQKIFVKAQYEGAMLTELVCMKINKWNCRACTKLRRIRQHLFL